MSLSIGLRIASSLPVLSGAGILSMGLGVVPMDGDLEAVAAAVLGSAPPSAFYVFLGTSKILGALGLWGKGIFPRPLSFVALGTPAACAFYGHSQLGDGKAIGAAIYLLVLAACAFLDKPEEAGGGSRGGAAEKVNTQAAQKAETQTAGGSGGRGGRGGTGRGYAALSQA